MLYTCRVEEGGLLYTVLVCETLVVKYFTQVEPISFTFKVAKPSC